MLTITIIAALYVTALIASIATLATSPSFERTITIDHAPATIVQPKTTTDIQAIAHHYASIEEKRTQFEALRHYHV